MSYYYKQIPAGFASQIPFTMYKSWIFNQTNMRKEIRVHGAERSSNTSSIVEPDTGWTYDKNGYILDYNYLLANIDNFCPVSESTNYNYVVSGSSVSGTLKGFADLDRVTILSHPTTSMDGFISVHYNNTFSVYTESQQSVITGSTYRKNMWWSIWNLFYRKANGSASLNLLDTASNYPVQYAFNSASCAAIFDTQFRTGSLDSIALIYDIPKRYFGEQIKPKTFSLNTGSISIYDNGYGSLIESANTSKSLGNIAYDKGLVIITTGSYVTALSKSLDLPGSLSFRFTSSYTAFENEFICVAKANEFNFTNNRTAYGVEGNWKFSDVITYNSASSTETPPEATVSQSTWVTFKFRPFVTGIGLYDDYGSLIAYGKINTPIRMEDRLDTIFVVSFDT